MSNQNNRFESMLFNNETTSRTEYRDGKVTASTRTEYISKPQCLRIRPTPLKDLHTLVDWRIPNVPMDLYIKPKEIVRTDPRDIQKRYDYPEDFKRELVRKTRPRLVMTPGISLDNLKDGARQQLIEDVYTTTTIRATRDTAALYPGTTVRAPFPGTTAPANPITLPKLQPPVVTPEWRMDSVSWDCRQLRAYADPTKEFWLARSPRCQECKDTAEREELKKMRRRGI